MYGAMNDLTADQALRLRLDALFTDYVQCIDCDALEDWPDFFIESGRYRITTRENFEGELPASPIYCDGQDMMRDRISAMRRANVFDPQTYCHTFSAIQVLGEEEGTFRVRSNFTVIRTMADGEMSVFAAGFYLDWVTEEAGSLKFAERIVVLDSRRIDTLLVIPL